jgi:hypothetical protein
MYINMDSPPHSPHQEYLLLKTFSKNVERTVSSGVDLGEPGPNPFS